MYIVKDGNKFRLCFLNAQTMDVVEAASFPSMEAVGDFLVESFNDGYVDIKDLREVINVKKKEGTTFAQRIPSRGLRNSGRPSRVVMDDPQEHQRRTRGASGMGLRQHIVQRERATAIRRAHQRINDADYQFEPSFENVYREYLERINNGENP